MLVEKIDADPFDYQFLLHAVEVCLFNLLLQGIPNLNCCKR